MHTQARFPHLQGPRIHLHLWAQVRLDTQTLGHLLFLLYEDSETGKNEVQQKHAGVTTAALGIRFQAELQRRQHRPAGQLLTQVLDFMSLQAVLSLVLALNLPLSLPPSNPPSDIVNCCLSQRSLTVLLFMLEEETESVLKVGLHLGLDCGL